MTNTNWRGPTNSLGAMEDSSVQVDDGPNYAYQGTMFPDLRNTTFAKDNTAAGRVPGFLDNPQIVVVDNIPSQATTTILAAASTTLASTAMTLVTVAPGNTTAGVPSVATGVPLIPFGATAAVTAAAALDFGFTTGTTTAASSTVVVLDTTLFSGGQWISIGGAANSGKTATLLTQVQTIGTSSITISPAASGSLTNAPIGWANLWDNNAPPSTQFGPSSPVPTSVAVHKAAGMFRAFDPLAAISRNIVVQATSTAGAGGAFLVSGWDVFGQAMSESITVAAATTTAKYGKKAFKYIKSVIPQFTDTAGSYSVGVGDTFGFPIRMDRFEYLQYSWNGILVLNQTGFIAAVTSAASTTTGDVRGTLQVSTQGNGTGIAGGQTSNGVARLWILQTMPLWNDIAGTPTNTVPFFGVTQA